MKTLIRYAGAAATGLLTLALVTGCESADQKALDQAKSQAATTHMPQQVQYVDGNGQTVTTTVQPPATQGAAEQVATTVTPPAPGQPKPAKTAPVVTPLGQAAAMQQSAAYNGPTNGTAYANNGAPVNDANNTAPGYGQPAPNGQPAGQPAEVNLSIPAGTEIAIRINQDISVKHSHAGERFSGEVAEPIERDGQVLVPRGTPVGGRVDEAHRRGHFKGASVLELRLTSMRLNGYDYPLDTHDSVHVKHGKGKRSAAFIGGMTGAGMLIGGLATGGVGLAIGGASGAGAGTLIAGATGNRDINIPAESIVHFRLADQLVVQNP
jgi:hypothetical protein